MARTHVSSCVLEILSSFSNGLDVFRKLRERRNRKKRSARKEDVVDEREMRLTRSLRQGPEDISREYQRSMYGAGDQFAVGDALAQTSLAEILLRLNTGLVYIIASFANSDSRHMQIDHQALTDLSDRSRIDTCRTLRHLFQRLSQPKPRHAISSREHVDAVSRHGRTDGERKRRKARAGYTKVREPMLAQVVIANSSKPSQVALVRPGERRKRSQSSTGSGSSSLSKTPSEPSSIEPTPLPTPPPEYTFEQQYSLEQQARPPVPRLNTAPNVPKPRRKRSAMNVSTAHLAPKLEDTRAYQSMPRLPVMLEDSVEALPPLPNTAPLLRPVPARRKPTPTYYSIASDSTKLGEIPLHKWAVPYDFDRMSVLNKEAERNGWPLNQLDNQESRKKKFGLFRLFGKKSG